MEEQHTRQALDEIAELFLTAPGGAAAPRRDATTRDDVAAESTTGQGDANASAPGPAPAAATSTSDPASHADDDPLAGPEPMRLAPKLPPAAPRLASGEAEPRLRLHREQQAQAPPCAVEAVLLGNLPGMSGPWLTQYAQRLAQAAGPVAILHLDRRRIDLELVESTEQRLAAPTTGLATADGGDDDPEPAGLLDRLHALLTDPDRPLRRLLVHVSPGMLGELDGPTRWTLLTGGDDMAVAAAIRLLDEASDAAPHQPRQVDVMIMGSDEQASESAGEKLRAAADLVPAPVRIVGHQRQMVPVALRQLGRFDTDDATLATLRRDLARLERLGEGRPARREGTGARRHEAEASQRRPREAEAVAEAQPAAAAAPEAAEPSAPGVGSAKSEIRNPKSEIASPPDLAAFLTTAGGPVAGGVPLEARCPQQPDTQLVLATDGTLHLLRRHRAATSDDADLAALRSALLELLAARQWVREHLELLQLTQRQCRFDTAAEPVLHLFTHRAELATTLATRLGAMVKLHLLRDVGTADEPRWFCTPLN